MNTLNLYRQNRITKECLIYFVISLSNKNVQFHVNDGRVNNDLIIKIKSAWHTVITGGWLFL